MSSGRRWRPGKLWYIIVGVRGQRIPWGALQDRISMGKGRLIATGHVFIPYSDPAVAAWSWACRWPITAKTEHKIRTPCLLRLVK